MPGTDHPKWCGAKPPRAAAAHLIGQAPPALAARPRHSFERAPGSDSALDGASDAYSGLRYPQNINCFQSPGISTFRLTDESSSAPLPRQESQDYISTSQHSQSPLPQPLGRAASASAGSLFNPPPPPICHTSDLSPPELYLTPCSPVNSSDPFSQEPPVHLTLFDDYSTSHSFETLYNGMGSQNTPPTPTESVASGSNQSPGPSEAASETYTWDRRRNIDPPKNADGKLCCDHADCKEKNHTFDLKCQWNKHMDKHERPYLCKVPGCEKLKGFTYAGGLLRHQREVHKMHGGSQWMCPIPYCKRNTALGFARKENLKEHMRRTHNNADLNVEPQATTPEAPSPEKPGGFSAINHPSYPSTPKKRRRTVSSTPGPLLKDEAGDEDDDGVGEIHRLRKDNFQLREDLKSRDERIRALQTTIEALERSISSIFSETQNRPRT